jgi:hypothetical protein
MDAFLQAVSDSRDIIVDRMNFNRVQRATYIEWARAAGYEIRVELFCVPHDICLERCQARTGHPTIRSTSDTYKALSHFFRFYEKPTEEEGQVTVHEYKLPDRLKQLAIICDLDGTLCNIDHRLHHVRNGNKDWDSFFAGISDDSINGWCSRLLRDMQYNIKIVLCSGRGQEYFIPTAEWLNQHDIPYNRLFMRPKKNYQRDDLVKEMLLDFEILPRYDVLFAVDDRQQVIAMWRRRGIICLDCAGEKGNF